MWRFRPVMALLLAVLPLLLLSVPVGEEPPVPPRYLLPQGAQLLTFPLEDGLVTAGFQNARYLQDQSFAHFGMDFTPGDGGISQVSSLGSGVVLGTEFCDNSLGNVVVVQYDRVYDPTLDRVTSLVVRYYHLLTASVQAGDTLANGQVIGSVDGGHQWYNHVHIELDADTQFPFHTPQVAEATSQLLVRHPANGQGLLDPASMLVLGAEQEIGIHPAAIWCATKDRPRFYRGEFAFSTDIPRSNSAPHGTSAEKYQGIGAY